MTAQIISAEVLARCRTERDRRRQQREALKGSILGLDDEDQQRAPAFSAQCRKPTR